MKKILSLVLCASLTASAASVYGAYSVNLNKIVPHKKTNTDCESAPHDYRMFFKNALSKNVEVNQYAVKIEYVVDGKSYEKVHPLTTVQADYGEEIFSVTGNAACAAQMSSMKITLTELNTTGGDISKPTLKSTSGCVMATNNFQAGMVIEKDVNKWTDNNYICN